MSNDQNAIKYAKHNKVRIKAGIKREEITRMLLDFFEEIKDRPTGMKGFMIMDDLQDIQESVVLTLWQRKEDMDCFYKSGNKILSYLVEKLHPSFEQLPVRKDYHVTKFNV
jgi:hypothetical protein